MLCCRTCVLSRFEQANVTHCYRACVLSMLSEHIATAHVFRTTHCSRILAVLTFPLNSCGTIASVSKAMLQKISSNIICFVLYRPFVSISCKNNLRHRPCHFIWNSYVNLFRNLNQKSAVSFNMDLSCQAL